MIRRPLVRLLTRVRRNCDRLIRFLGGPRCRDVILSVGAPTDAGRIPITFLLTCPCCGEVGHVPLSVTPVQAQGIADDLHNAAESVHLRRMLRAASRSLN